MTVPAAVMVELGHMCRRATPDAAPVRDAAPSAPRSSSRDAGFAETEVEEMAMSYRFADADELWAFASELAARSRSPSPGSRRDRAAVRAEIESRATRTDDGGFALAGVSLNVVSVVA